MHVFKISNRENISVRCTDQNPSKYLPNSFICSYDSVEILPPKVFFKIMWQTLQRINTSVDIAISDTRCVPVQ